MLKYRTINSVFIALVFSLIVIDYAGEVSVWIYVGVIVFYLGVQVYGSTVLSAQFFIQTKCKGKADSNAVALTFDDGPFSGKTQKILDILKLYNVPAAFFCVGHRMEKHPEIVKRIHNEGHVLANHSYWHGKMFDLQSKDKISKELTDTDAVIEEHTGRLPKFFRPPYGVTNPMVEGAITSIGYTTVGWSLRSFDTVTKNPDVLKQRVISSVKSGDIILLHDYCDSTITALPALIDNIKKLGLKIVRVDELLNENPYV
jgi:peptidoglycan/xylan/chitin deacetylase (PgdA/CDA1 family)